MLAGGAARRFPGKLFASLGDMPMLARVVRNLAPASESTRGAGFAPDVTIATTAALEGEIRALLERWTPQVPRRFVLDAVPSAGPRATLRHVAGRLDADWLFLAGGDMPLLDLATLSRLAAARDAALAASARGERARPTAVAVRGARGREGLGALYCREALLAPALADDADASLHGLLDRLVVVDLEPEPRTRAAGSPFLNVNRAEDLDAVSASLDMRRGQRTRRAVREESRMQTTRQKSHDAFARARGVIPGGVNSTVRAFKGVGGEPVFVKSASGCRFEDLDGTSYIDYVMSWGPLILGHAAPAVIDAVREAALRGTSYGAPTEVESDLAELVVAMVPSAEKVRFCSSGSEATTFALRLARGITGRSKVVKFAGCYHGSVDAFLVSAGSSALTIGVPDSAGVTSGTIADTLVAPYNDAEAVRALCARHAGEIAAIIVEPYVGNMGLVLPEPGFLHALRDAATASGALLIFDEVMTGFRVAPGGVQEREGVSPDLTTLGKIIGGGLPVGAVAGPARHLDHFTPDGRVFQAGTLSGNPLAMAAGVATLRALREPGVYERLEAAGERFTSGMSAVFSQHGVPHVAAHRGSMVGFFFTAGPVVDLASAKRSDTALYARFFHAMLDRGVYLAPSQFEAGFLSLAHDDDAIDRTLAMAGEALAQARDDS